MFWNNQVFPHVEIHVVAFHAMLLTLLLCIRVYYLQNQLCYCIFNIIWSAIKMAWCNLAFSSNICFDIGHAPSMTQCWWFSVLRNISSISSCITDHLVFQDTLQCTCCAEVPCVMNFYWVSWKTHHLLSNHLLHRLVHQLPPASAKC